MKKCSWCGKEYPDDTELCPLDQEPLISEKTAKSKSHWKSLGLLVLGSILVVATFLNLDRFLSPKFFEFTHKDAKYYSEFADACDAIRRNHPLGTNKFFDIDETNPLIPKVIQALHPRRITITEDGIWIAHGQERFAISWSPREGTTNPWVLVARGEGIEQTVFATNR